MTIGKLALAGALAVLAASTAAASPPQGAGWTFAHWGMTPAQVRTASAGKVHADPDMADNDILDGDTAIGAMKFMVRFGYEHGRLASVTLDIDSGLDADNPCAPVRAWLKKTYGAPALTSEGGYNNQEWPDRKTGNTVQLSFLGQGETVCHLIYEPGPTLAKDIADLKAAERQNR
jgi:hypothetical protein